MRGPLHDTRAAVLSLGDRLGCRKSYEAFHVDLFVAVSARLDATSHTLFDQSAGGVIERNTAGFDEDFAIMPNPVALSRSSNVRLFNVDDRTHDQTPRVTVHGE